MTSSIIAAETSVVPIRVVILPSSLSTDTVMATLVAVRIVPTNTPCTTSVKPLMRPLKMNGRLMTVPSARGIATPETATRVAATPVRRNSTRSVSRPAENIIMITPILENTSSTVKSCVPSSRNSSSVTNSAMLGVLS